MRMLKNPLITSQRTYVNLTNRERDTLECMVKGMSRKMIATELGVVEETVNDYVKHIYKKLHVNCIAAAVSRAVKDGIVRR